MMSKTTPDRPKNGQKSPRNDPILVPKWFKNGPAWSKMAQKWLENGQERSKVTDEKRFKCHANLHGSASK